jgi:hypothetical protein
MRRGCRQRSVRTSHHVRGPLQGSLVDARRVGGARRHSARAWVSPFSLTEIRFVTMLSEMDTEREQTPDDMKARRAPVAPCPQCGFPMMAVRGSKDAVCRNCGFKDSCCY